MLLFQITYLGNYTRQVHIQKSDNSSVISFINTPISVISYQNFVAKHFCQENIPEYITSKMFLSHINSSGFPYFFKGLTFLSYILLLTQGQ